MMQVCGRESADSHRALPRVAGGSPLIDRSHVCTTSGRVIGSVRCLHIVLCALCVCIAGCTTTDYIGKTYPPTPHVDVFFSSHDVTHAYEVMGQIRAEGDDIVSYDSMQQKLVQEAMQKGADAILIEQVETTETGSTTVANQTREKRKKGRESSATTTSSTQIEKDRVITGKLLKYR